MHLPFLPTPEFLVDNAKFLAVASDLAYDVPPDQLPDDDDTPAARSAGLELGLKVRGFGRSAELIDTQGFVGWSDPAADSQGFRVLAFRGTEPRQLVDWLVDARLAQRPGGGVFAGRVHEGFDRALMAVWGDVCGILASRPGTGDWPLFVTGHSLGGALATLASCPPKQAGVDCVPPMATYTFGSPRVGDAAFCGAYPGPHYRVVNKLDIVPEVPLAGGKVPLGPLHLPAAAMLIGNASSFAARLNRHLQDAAVGIEYGHVEELVYIGRDGTISRGGTRPGWTTAAVALAIATRAKTWWDGIADHSIKNYVAALHA